MEHVCCSSVLAKAKSISSAALRPALSLCATFFCAGLLLIVSLAVARASDIQSSNDNTAGFNCPQSGLTIYASDDELALKACKVSETASINLASCGLSSSPSIDLYIVNEIVGAGPHCLGVYVCEGV